MPDASNPRLASSLDPKETTVKPRPALLPCAPAPRRTDADRSELGEPEPDAQLDAQAVFEELTGRLHDEHVEQAILTAIDVEHATGNVKRADRIRKCGSERWILRHNDHSARYRYVNVTCKDKLCPRCCFSRGMKLKQNLLPKLRDRVVRLLTLTLKAEQTDLTARIDRLYKAFRKLRTSSLWKERVTGGCAVLEITRSEANNSWHVHLHCIIEGSYLPQAELARQWLTATGNSKIVDVRLIRNPLKAVNYVAKYITKSSMPKIAGDPMLLREFIRATQRRRALMTFGDWQNWPLIRNQKLEGWHVAYSESELRSQARVGTAAAIAILLAFERALGAESKNWEFIVDRHDEARAADLAHENRLQWMRAETGWQNWMASG